MSNTFKVALVLLTIILIGVTDSLRSEENEVRIIFEGEKIVGYEQNNKRVMASPKNEDGQAQTRPEVFEGEELPAEDTKIPSEGSSDSNESTTLAQNEKPTVAQDFQKRVQMVEPEAGKHLLQNPDFLFPVEVQVYNWATEKWEVRKPQFDADGKCHIVFHDGEQYSIVVINKSKRNTAWGVLVDGFNTLSQEVNGQFEFAPKVSIDEAVTWMIESGKENGISGFYGNHKKLKAMEKDDLTVDTENGDFYRAFMISKDSLAKKRNDVSNQGEIRVGIFELITPDSSTMIASSPVAAPQKSASRRNLRGSSFGTAVSEEVDVKLHEQEGTVGRKIADYILYYDVE